MDITFQLGNLLSVLNDLLFTFGSSGAGDIPTP